MNVKSLLFYGGILVLSVLITVGWVVIQFALGIFYSENGFPFKYTSFAFLGSSQTNYVNLIADILFWYIVIYVLWRLLIKLRK